MQRSTLLFLLMVCAIGCAITALAWHSDNEAPRPPGTADDRDPVARDGSAGSRQREDQEPLPADAPHVVLRVASRERFTPPPAEPCLLRHVDGSELVTSVLAGVGAGFDADWSHRGVAMVRARFEAGEVLRQVAIEPAGREPGRVGARIVMRGRVVDERDLPIAGASVWFGELGADGSRREQVVDDAGRFELDVPSGAGVPFVVRAPGYASVWRPLEVSGRPSPLREVLRPACALQLQLAATRKRGSQPVAYVLPEARVSTELSQWPFWLQALTGGYPIDADGRCAVDDLPRDGQLGVVVRHALAPLAAPAPVEPRRRTRAVAGADALRRARAHRHGCRRAGSGACGRVAVGAHAPALISMVRGRCACCRRIWTCAVRASRAATRPARSSSAARAMRRG